MYFPRFAGLEYLSYQMIWKYEAVRNEFKKCAREHLNNPEIGRRLYREGLGAEEFTQKLREVVYPIYCSAKTCGFSSWEYEPGVAANVDLTFNPEAEGFYLAAEKK